MAQAELSLFRDNPKTGSKRAVAQNFETAGTRQTGKWTAGTTSTQVGKACETLVACSLMLASKGRLAPFVPLADDDGIDLILLDKLTGRSILVQVKGWTGLVADGDGLVQFDVRKKTIRAHYDSLLVAVRIDLREVRIVQSWAMPMSAVPGVSSDKGSLFALRASTKPGSNDRCRRYRTESLDELVKQLTEVLDGKNRPGDSGGSRSAAVNHSGKPR